jgi:hypothetical protein
MVGRCKYSNWPNNCHRALGYEWQLIQQVSWRDGCNMLGQRHDPNQTFVLSDTCRFADTDGLANDIWCDSSACSTNWSHEYFGILAFMSIISTALCWWLWIYILDRVPAWEASLSVLGTPVVAIFSSHLAFGEDFKSSEIAGILLIGGGLVLLSFLSWMNRPRF